MLLALALAVLAALVIWLVCEHLPIEPIEELEFKRIWIWEAGRYSDWTVTTYPVFPINLRVTASRRDPFFVDTGAIEKRERARKRKSPSTRKACLQGHAVALDRRAKKSTRGSSPR